MTSMHHEPLPQVLWIGGPPGAGKTTVARLLARRHALRWYNVDAQTWRHLDRAVARGVRNAQRFAALTPAQRRLARPEEIEYERGPLIVEDLLGLPRAPVMQTVAEVERVFARRLTEGHVGTAVAQRRELLRYANLAIIEQCQGWLAHQPERDVRPAAQQFDCECARPGCAVLVELPLEQAEAAASDVPPSIVAAGHQSLQDRV